MNFTSVYWIWVTTHPRITTSFTCSWWVWSRTFACTCCYIDCSLCLMPRPWLSRPTVRITKGHAHLFNSVATRQSNSNSKNHATTTPTTMDLHQWNWTFCNNRHRHRAKASNSKGNGKASSNGKRAMVVISRASLVISSRASKGRRRRHVRWFATGVARQGTLHVTAELSCKVRGPLQCHKMRMVTELISCVSVWTHWRRLCTSRSTSRIMLLWGHRWRARKYRSQKTSEGAVVLYC